MSARVTQAGAWLLVLFVLPTACSTSSEPLADPSLRLGDPTAGGQIRLEARGTFDQPVHVTSPPGDRSLFIVERPGRVRIWMDDVVLKRPFLDISKNVSAGTGRGLLSIAFPPDYQRDRRVYVSYTDLTGNSRIDEYSLDPTNPNRIDPTTRRLILLVEQTSPINNGGLIGFDRSGMLLVATGDDGLKAPAQDGNLLLGKFLRIDPKNPSDGRPYSIPEDNPFVSGHGARAEIWAYGLQNPWRWAFNADTEDLYVADVGEGSEEINFVPKALQAGANYGWPRYEGHEVFDATRAIAEERLVDPILSYPVNGARCAVIGGSVYRGSVAALRGIFTYGDSCDGSIKAVRVTNGLFAEEIRFKELSVPQLVAFGEDSEGEMYIISGKGGVFRFVGGHS